MIVVVMGLSGSGKSFLASILHQDFGFEWLRSDAIRKELAGLKPHESAKAPYQEGIYSPEWTKKVYERMVERAKELAKEGKKVVLDATFLEEWQRNLVKEAFPNALFILATAQEEEILRRLRERKDISDADIQVYLRQKERFKPPDYALPVETQKSRQELKEILRELIEGFSPSNT